MFRISIVSNQKRGPAAPEFKRDNILPDFAGIVKKIDICKYGLVFFFELGRTVAISGNKRRFP